MLCTLGICIVSTDQDTNSVVQRFETVTTCTSAQPHDQCDGHLHDDELLESTNKFFLKFLEKSRQMFRKNSEENPKKKLLEILLKILKIFLENFIKALKIF